MWHDFWEFLCDMWMWNRSKTSGARVRCWPTKTSKISGIVVLNTPFGSELTFENFENLMYSRARKNHTCECLCNALQHTATHCNILQHTATHCNTLQHTYIPARAPRGPGGAEPLNSVRCAAKAGGPPLTHTLLVASAWSISTCVTWHIRVTWRIRETWRIQVCGMTHWYVWHDLLMCVASICVDTTHLYVWTWLIYMYGHDSSICVDMTHLHVWTWLIYMCGHDSSIRVVMTHFHMWWDAFMCVTCCSTFLNTHPASRICIFDINLCDMTATHCTTLQHTATLYMTLQHTATHVDINLCDMTYSSVWHDSLICVTWLIDVRDVTCSCV